MKKNLFVKLILIGLTLAMLLSCFIACDKTEEPDESGKETVAGDNGNETDNGNGNETDNGTTEDGEATNAPDQGGSNNTGVPSNSKDMADIKAEINSLKVEDFEESSAKTDYLKVVVKNYGEFIIRVRNDIAPATGGGIQWLVPYGWYNGLTFHRVVKGSFIHGGCPNGDGTGVSGISLRGEFADNGVENPLKHVRGVVSAFRFEDQPNSASCQFLVLTEDCPQFDGNRTAFGYVVAGLEVVDAISNAEVKDNGKGEMSSPVEKIVMEKIVFVKMK